MTKLLLTATLVGLLSLATALELNSYCSGRRTAAAGNYEVSWQVDETLSYVMFNVSADTTGWVAIGFSENELMEDTDVVIGGANADNMSFVEDRYAFQRGAAPRLDATSNIMDFSASLTDGRQMISFTRPIDTGDTVDDFSLDMCLNLIWAFGGNIIDFTASPVSISGHNTANRGVFREQICLNMCDAIVLCSDCTSTDDGLFTYCWTLRGEWVDFNATAQTELWVGLGVSMDRMMPDTDVVIGAINPEDLTQYFVQDRYAAARAPPPLDERSDITAVSAMTNDGYTTISFSRRVDTGDDEDDIDLTMCRYILWAYGGMVDFDALAPTSQHTNQGVFSEQLCLPNITSCPVPDPCSGCESADNGRYTYCWTRCGDYVHFTVTAETDLWVGLGVSMDRMMPNTDVVIGAADATRSFVQDRFATARAAPPLDESNDLMAYSATNENSMTTVRFTRLIDTGDDEDDIDLTECRYILWAYGGMVDFDAPGPTSPHTRRGVFGNQLCLPDIATCPGPTVAVTPTTAGAAMISVSIATLLMALVVAVLY